MFGISVDSPQRVRPARLQRPKQQQQQQQQQQRRLHTKQQQHALFVQTRRQAAAEAAAAAAAAVAAASSDGLSSRSDSAAYSTATAAAATTKTGKLVAVTTYSGSLEDYLLLHSTDGSSSGSSSYGASPLRGSSEEELRSSSNLWIPPHQQQQQEQEEEITGDRRLSSNCSNRSSQQQQPQQEQDGAVRQPSNASEEEQQQDQQDHDIEHRLLSSSSSQQQQQQQSQQQQDPCSSKSGGRLIEPPAACTPEGVQKHLWPSLTLSLLPHLDSLEDCHQYAAFARSASELQRFAAAPVQTVSAAAAALKLQQQQQQMRRPLKKTHAHWTLAEGLRNICNALKPQQPEPLPPIKLPVYFPNDQEVEAGGVASGAGQLSMCSNSRQSSTVEQSCRGSSSSTVTSKPTAESPFAEDVSVHLKGGGKGSVVGISPANNLIVKLKSGMHVEAHPSECRFLVGGILVPPTQQHHHQQQQQQQQQQLHMLQMQLKQQQQQQQHQQRDFKLSASMRGVETIPSVSELLQRAAATAAGSTQNTVMLPSLASVSRVDKTRESVAVVKVLKKAAENKLNQADNMQAIFPPEAERQPSTANHERDVSYMGGAASCSTTFCMPQQQNTTNNFRRLGSKPQTNTYDLIKAPGIVRPLYDIIAPSPPMVSRLLQQQQQQPLQSQQQLQQSQQIHPQQMYPQQMHPQQMHQQQVQPQQLQQHQQMFAGHLAALGGPGAPAAAAAAALEVAGACWFEGLQQQMKREELQQYADTAPPGQNIAPTAAEAAVTTTLSWTSSRQRSNLQISEE
ncbi:hypothetical protein, conserved [Eimeria maxima]|uniref:Uncharacterized protein n=1 Tax=Eimeria maxima TaxID=5804 RepID=U6M1E5_EIMMA|nr:hypothetical protein, conserved [Eimeria maxima]CDJ56269.1 hypothetical protein, conserved [Eimeria maxima]